MTKFGERIFFGGSFDTIGTLTTKALGSYQPSTNTWHQLSGGLNPGNVNIYVAALATYSINGTPSLVVGGQFASARNGATDVAGTTGIAAWNGTQWSSLSTGWTPATGRSVWTLLSWPQSNGSVRLVAGGGWPEIGAATADGIAYFDGTSWNNIAGASDTGIAGTFSPTVFFAAIYNNQLFIGGRFDSVNGAAAPLVARWTGSAWTRPGSLSAGSVISDISSMHVWDDGTGSKLYVGGYDMRVGGRACAAAVWNGSVWARVGNDFGGRCTSLANYNDGSGDKLYGGWTADGTQRYLYRLEGTQWSPIGTGMSVPIAGNFPSVFGLKVIDNLLYVGGDFQLASGVPSYGIAQYSVCLGPSCDSIDFNGDNLFPTDEDVIDFFSALAGQSCAACGDIDFNNDGLFPSDQDVIAFLSVFAGGPCS
jgi:hypothetical protein